MFEIKNIENQTVPVKVWLENEKQLDQGCLEQAVNLSRLPFIHQWVALMPDTHQGIGMPIGGVVATKDVIIPNAVGVDIGCGMAYIQTDIGVKGIKRTRTGSGTLLQTIIGEVLRTIPVGYSHHKKRQSSVVIDKAKKAIGNYGDYESLINELEDGYFQIGTLGGGNHFIEFQEDERGKLGIMIHSGSRHFGYNICHYFHKLAVEQNEQEGTPLLDKSLSYLRTESKVGLDYIQWMHLAMDFAKENRDIMMQRVQEIVERHVERHFGREAGFYNYINCHHNYASLEEHYGEKVWVHRKGAIRAQKGEKGIIPGAMGSYSYLVEGLGNPESFCSCSHGAGRRYSRKAATDKFSVEKVMLDLKSQDVILGKHTKKDVAEESRFAYKDIEEVMQSQADLVKSNKRLKTIGVVKG